MESATALYAALTTLLFAALSLNVSRLRGKYKTALGENPPEVLAAVRAQGNCAEYLAILFLMMLLAEFTGGSRTGLHVLGGSILLARVLHAHGALTRTGATLFVGATLTYLALLGSAGYVLYLRFA